MEPADIINIVAKWGYVFWLDLHLMVTVYVLVVHIVVLLMLRGSGILIIVTDLEAAIVCTSVY